MLPTLADGDRVMMTRRFDAVNRGDIVAFKYPKDESKNFIQRVVALPGDRIQMTQGRVMLNDSVLDEAFVAEENRSFDSWGPITVPPGKYFMMGDNRRNASDSRSWGSVRREAIWGKLIDR